MDPEKRQKWTGIAVVALVLIAFSLLFGNLSQLWNIAKDFLSIISSVLFGAAFAFLMNPIMNFVDSRLHRFLSRRNMAERTAKRLSRGISIVVALIVFVLSIYAIFVLVVPQLIESLQKLLSPSNLETYKERIDAWVVKILNGTRYVESYRANSDRIFEAIGTWLSDTLLNQAAILNVAQWAYSAVMLVFNALIGIVIAIYILIYKDTFQAQAKKIVVAIFHPEHANRVIETAQTTNKLLNGFLVGKLIDSIIVALICYVGMRIMGLPYPELISVIVGITNIIPFFGPLLGMIPSALIILVENPLQAFYFLIFVLALQQVDGNIIGPRILGETVGMSDFWILVSITVFGGLFGFTGMILGVPIFGVIYTLISDAVNRALKRKKMPVNTKKYYSISTVEDLSEPEEHPSAPEPVCEAEYDADEEMEIEDIEDDNNLNL